MSNIINGVATDYEMPATNYTTGTDYPYGSIPNGSHNIGNYGQPINNDIYKETNTMEENENIITSEEHNIASETDETIGMDVRMQIHNLAANGYSAKEIAESLGIEEAKIIPIVTPKYDKHEYAERKGRNNEYYPDPTYHKARRNYQNKARDSKATPVYISSRSRRYETIGLIMRICEMAGFELAERVVLRDKETGEVLK